MDEIRISQAGTSHRLLTSVALHDDDDDNNDDDDDV